MKPGTYQTLIVVKEVDFGLYLAENENAPGRERVLLPKKYVPEHTGLHDRIRVFLYLDSHDRLIATTQKPSVTLGHMAALTVSQTTNIGAFLDWGLPKDLLLPFHEQLRRVKKGDTVLVRLYLDKSGRLCASMKHLYDLMRTDSPYQKGDTVTGRIYEFSDNFGTFVAVDDRFSGRIPPSEDHSRLSIGQIIQASVTHVKPDGKLDLTTRKKAYEQIADDSKTILALLDSYAGVLPFNDKASPETIMREAHMSKNAFKRAVGHLYKERKIEITDSSIRLL